MGSTQKVFVFDDAAKHKERNDCWLLLFGKVYNVTQFLEERLGGNEVLLAATGKDATMDFVDVGHSDDAKALMEKYYIGEVDTAIVPPPRKFRTQASIMNHKSDDLGLLIKIMQFLVPLLMLSFAFGLQYLTKKENLKSRLINIFPIMER